MGRQEHEVVVVGGGPTGLMLAGELALAGVDVVVVERRPTQELKGSRAGGLHARSIEVLDQRGIAERFLEAGQVAQVAGFAMTRLDISGFPSRHPYGLGLWQNQIERLLAEWTAELGVPIRYGAEVTGFAQDEDGVDVELGEEGRLRAAYLVGTDGGRSLVRRTAGIDFPGWEATSTSLIGEVEMTEAPELGIKRDAAGVHSLGREHYEIRDGEVVFADEGPVRVMVTVPHATGTADPTLEDLREALAGVWGTDFGAHSPTWLSRFTDASRQAAAYRRGRVLLAGDAAHVHSPAGGQGLNLGLQDAVNLGWKLARVVKGTSPDALLDTYHAERHPVGAQVLRTTMAAAALMRPDDRMEAIRESIGELLGMEEPRKRLGGRLSGLDIRYDLGDGHPLLGRRMPDLDVVTAEGPTRVYAFLRRAEPLLLDFGADLEAPSTVRHVRAEPVADWELPVVGPVTAPTAVLVRPDGHVAWVGVDGAAGLAEAVERTFQPGGLAV